MRVPIARCHRGLRKICSAAAATLLAAASCDSAFARSAPRQLGAMSIERPAFCFLEALGPGRPLDLLVSGFKVMGRDSVQRVAAVGAELGALAEVHPRLLTDQIVWPNGVRPVPAGAVGRTGLLVAGGFLVPGKSTGAVTLLPLTEEGAPTGTAVTLTTPRNGWFYHRAVWKDMDGDGRLDVLTARARKPAVGAPGGELLWLEQPADVAAHDGPWTEHLLAAGPDVHFRVHDLNGDGVDEILAAQFFTKRLTLLLADGGGLREVLIDGRIGSAFDLQVVDLNGDGRLDLLATNHEPDAAASVFAYEIPDDLRTSPWPRRTLLSGIATTNPGMHQASPGQAQAFWPQPARPTGKPLIVVSGDGSQRAHLLSPRSLDPTDWVYRETVLLKTDCTVGQSAVGDADGDGWVEVFVPAYDRNRIHVFTFAPAPVARGGGAGRGRS